MLFFKRAGVGLRLKSPNAAASEQFQRLAGGRGRPGAPRGGVQLARDAKTEQADSPLSRGHCGDAAIPYPPLHGASPVPFGVTTQELWREKRPEGSAFGRGHLGPQTRQRRGRGREGGRWPRNAKGVFNPDFSGKIRKRGGGGATGAWGVARRTKRPW